MCEHAESSLVSREKNGTRRSILPKYVLSSGSGGGGTARCDGPRMVLTIRSTGVTPGTLFALRFALPSKGVRGRVQSSLLPPSMTVTYAASTSSMSILPSDEEPADAGVTVLPPSSLGVDRPANFASGLSGMCRLGEWVGRERDRGEERVGVRETAALLAVQMSKSLE